MSDVSRATMLRRSRRLLASGERTADVVAEESPAGHGPRRRAHMWQQWQAHKWGFDPQLWLVLQDPEVTDVFVNGTEAWVDRGAGCERLDWAPASDEECRQLAVRMAASAGRRLDDACPLADGFLGGTVRLHAVLPPLSGSAPLLSLRVFRPRGFSLEQLVESGMVDGSAADMLDALVQRRASILISGPTGVGKTTLLAALLAQVPHQQRLVCIEEVSELRPTHPHVVHLQERVPNVEDQGRITLADLVRAALRMRPDRLVLGECRGAEVREVMTALNTGHAGGFATVHANSTGDVPARLIALGALAGLSPQAVGALAAPAFDVVLQLGRGHDGQRLLTEIGVFGGTTGLQCATVARRHPQGSSTWEAGEAAGQLPEAAMLAGLP